MRHIFSLICIAAVVGLFINACVGVELRGDVRTKPQASSSPGGTLSAEWVQTTEADFETGTLASVKIANLGDGELMASSPQQGTFTSMVKEADFLFNAVGVRSTASVPRGSGFQMEIRVSANGRDWSQWTAVHADAADNKAKDDATSQIIATAPGKFLQYRVVFSPRANDSPTIEDITVTYINSSSGPDLAEAKRVTLPKAAGQPTIISRQGWGANEGYRFGKSGGEIWPAEFKKPEKIVVHHTLTRNDDLNPAATVRAVYYYHAMTLEWGDIGYNYVVDALGNIYEGRRGDGVVAGHAYGYNEGSIGIAVLGNYLGTEVSDPARKALVDLISWLSGKYSIDPQGKSFFVDRELPNISGHRDANATSCPGTNLYEIIPAVRKAVYAQLPEPKLVLESPAEGKSISQVALVKAVATSEKWPITKVEFFVDGESVSSPTGPDWVWQWDTTKVSDGTHEIKVVAQNALGKTATLNRKVNVWHPAVSWHFAEGSTIAPFQTWLLLLNPSTRPAKVIGTFWNESSKEEVREYSLAPKTRMNLFLNDVVPGQAFSTRLEADQFIFAERATFFGTEGHTSAGARNPSRQWYFAEGSTQSGFSTWLLLMNPNGIRTTAKITFYKMGQGTTTKEISIEPTSRLNVLVDREVPGASMGFKIESELPIVAERSVYFNQGKSGHSSVGATALSPTWYFAEGSGGSGFRTWVMLLNPGSERAEVKLSFMDEQGQTKIGQVAVPPNSRVNVLANELAGPGGFGIKVESSRPIVAERSIYFSDMRAGHNSVGMPNLSNQWYLPEGATTSGRAEWILLLNPNSLPAAVSVTYVTDKGDTKSEAFQMKPSSRLNILVNKAMQGANVSAMVQSDQPVAVERSIYFNDDKGATNSTGIAP